MQKKSRTLKGQSTYFIGTYDQLIAHLDRELEPSELKTDREVPISPLITT